MPSHLHEMLVEMFRDRPVLAAELLAGPLGIKVPTFQEAHVSPSELNDVTPTEYRADLVVSFTDGETVVLAVVLEAQLRKDRRKRRSWPAYVATLYARLGCPVVLLVMAPSARVAKWCAMPIRVGEPNFVLTPLAVGPRQIPAVTDPALAAENPELAVLSTLAHGDMPDRESIFRVFWAAMNALDPVHANLYADVVLARLPVATQKYLEVLMTSVPHIYDSDFARRYYGRGRAAGKAEGKVASVLAVLDARGLAVSEEMRDQISRCTDVDQLDGWIRRAATATTSDELFG
jgi:hypothetical protein